MFGPQMVLFTGKWGLLLGLGEGAWLCGSLHLDTWTHACPCVESCVCKGLEVFLGSSLCGHGYAPASNEHMAGGSRAGRLRGDGLH